MPEQHREFFKKIPMTAVALLDGRGRPWLSMIFDLYGSTESSSPNTLGYPDFPVLSKTLDLQVEPGSKIGLCGVELETRRRNRMNGTVIENGAQTFEIVVDQSYGNCPQYIQKREVSKRVNGGNSHDLEAKSEIIVENMITVDSKTLIESADTFFVASRSPNLSEDPRTGVDASHRGGNPGFVQVSSTTTLSFPDYSGNRFFNTIGNLELDNRIGLFFPDFVSGDAVFVTGQATVAWEDDRIAAFDGAERFVDVTIEQIVYAKEILPVVGELIEPWPVLTETGSWNQMELNLLKTDGYRQFEVVKREIESETIVSLYLKPADGGALESYIAGQYIPIQVEDSVSDQLLERTYTLSNKYSKEHYRISVKKESMGKASSALHDLAVGAKLNVGTPLGDFVLPDRQRDIVMISAGVGITPMMAMLESLVEKTKEGEISPSATRKLLFFHGVRNFQEQAFRERLVELHDLYEWLDIFFFYSEQNQLIPENIEITHKQFESRINLEALSGFLQFARYDFFLCGPLEFMQYIYCGLRDIGIERRYIHYETFGEGVLSHKHDTDDTINLPSQSTVYFRRSEITEVWKPTNGSLLEFAEAQGLSPKKNCRAGKCGTCSVTLVEGEVTYPVKPVIAPAEGQVLICCGYPATDTKVVLDI